MLRHGIEQRTEASVPKDEHRRRSVTRPRPESDVEKRSPAAASTTGRTYTRPTDPPFGRRHRSARGSRRRPRRNQGEPRGGRRSERRSNRRRALRRRVADYGRRVRDDRSSPTGGAAVRCSGRAPVGGRGRDVGTAAADRTAVAVADARARPRTDGAGGRPIATIRARS